MNYEAGFHRANCSQKNSFNNQPQNQKPDYEDRNGVIPLLRLSVGPQAFRFFPVMRKRIFRNKTYGKRNQGRQKDYVIEIAEKRNKIRDQIYGRKRIGYRYACKDFGNTRRVFTF